VEAVPYPLLLRKTGSAGNRILTSGYLYVARNSGHWNTEAVIEEFTILKNILKK
jgi:hypothetical protein